MNRQTGPKWIALLLVVAFLATGCVPPTPKDALKLTPESLQERQMQSRYYQNVDEQEVLTAGSGVLQDLGFNLDESETRLGLLVASKDRDAKDAGQIAASIVLFALVGVWIPTDDHQRMRASVVTCPSPDDSERITVRVTFQRIVWDSQDEVTKREELKSAEIYQEFFSRLSKSLFLEEHKI